MLHRSKAVSFSMPTSMSTTTSYRPVASCQSISLSRKSTASNASSVEGCILLDAHLDVDNHLVPAVSVLPKHKLVEEVHPQQCFIGRRLYPSRCPPRCRQPPRTGR